MSFLFYFSGKGQFNKQKAIRSCTSRRCCHQKLCHIYFDWQHLWWIHRLYKDKKVGPISLWRAWIMNLFPTPLLICWTTHCASLSSKVSWTFECFVYTHCKECENPNLFELSERDTDHVTPFVLYLQLWSIFLLPWIIYF